MNKKLTNTCDFTDAIVEELSSEDRALILGGGIPIIIIPPVIPNPFMSPPLGYLRQFGNPYPGQVTRP